jgi:hypothetical protein
MITLYIKEDCATCGELVDSLREISLAHNLVHVEFSNLRFIGKKQISNLPAITDGAKLIVGTAEVRNYIAKLEVIKAVWDRFQTDSCYCNQDGEIE